MPIYNDTVYIAINLLCLTVYYAYIVITLVCFLCIGHYTANTGPYFAVEKGEVPSKWMDVGFQMHALFHHITYGIAIVGGTSHPNTRRYVNIRNVRTIQTIFSYNISCKNKKCE